MTAKPQDLVANLAWDAVAARIGAGAAAVLPIGAGAKEHGFHLPMNTDEIQAKWLAGVIAREIDALIWPVLTYGYYPAFTHYAGSVSLSEQTFKAAVADILSGILAAGARPALIVNTGISTLSPVDNLVTEQFTHAPVHHLKVHEGPRYTRLAAELSEQAGGTHADEIETSRMLALFPSSVNMARALASPPGKGGGHGPLIPDDPEAANYSPSGSWGDPTLASAEKGRKLVAAMEQDVAEMARSARDDSRQQTPPG